MKNNIHKKEYVITKAEYDKLTEAYNKCQEDIINRKYTEEDLMSAFNAGINNDYGNGPSFDKWLNSLNKQDSGQNEQLCKCSSKILPNNDIQLHLCRKCQEELYNK